MAKNLIKTKIYIKGDLVVQSPLSVGSGEDVVSDGDVITDQDGTPIIPGSSIAGPVREYLNKVFNKEDNNKVNEYFGEKEDKSRISSIIFYDCCAKRDGNNPVSIRDGVKLNPQTRTAVDKSKYDYQVVNKNTVFQFRSEITIRENLKDEDEYYEIIFNIIKSLENGNIRLGAKTTRGLGKVKLENTKGQVIDLVSDRQKWIDFSWDKNNFNKFNKIDIFQNKNIKEFINPNKITCKFKIPYSLLIRHYNTNPQDPDSTHLTYPNKMGNNNQKTDGVPIIPGTSWAGVIRSGIYNILEELGVDENKIEDQLKLIFGHEGDKDKKENKKQGQPKKSKLIVEESIIKNGKMIKYTRNRIDRFTGGVIDGALFDEKPVYRGEVALDLEYEDLNLYQMALIKLALLDIGSGIQPLGGEVNVGRGILELNGNEIKIEDEESKELSDKIKEWKNVE